ncbi:hypothetical protein VCHENC03_2660 [Vibrio sp. HENC-03]|nr:hypothetical protein VCHENC03_2660 [Vibrio sp. HENC-03]
MNVTKSRSQQSRMPETKKPEHWLWLGLNLYLGYTRAYFKLA